MDLINCAICIMDCPRSLRGYCAPFDGTYLAARMERNCFNASKVSPPAPCKTSPTASSYNDSKPFELELFCADGMAMPLPTSKVLRLGIASESLPRKERGSIDVMLTLRNAVANLAWSSGQFSIVLASQPARAVLSNMASSMKSCASKCERDGLGEPHA